MKIRKNNGGNFNNDKNIKRNYICGRKKIYLFYRRENTPENIITASNYDKLSLDEKSNQNNISNDSNHYSMPKTTTRTNYKRINFDFSVKNKQTKIIKPDKYFQLNNIKHFAPDLIITKESINDYPNNPIRIATPMIKTKKIIFRKNNLFQINTFDPNLYLNNSDYKNHIISETFNSNKNEDLIPNNLVFNFYKKNELLNNQLANYNPTMINESYYDDKMSHFYNKNILKENQIRLFKVKQIKEIEEKIKIEENKLSKLKEEKNDILNSFYIFEPTIKSSNIINDIINSNINKEEKIDNRINNNNIFNNCKFIRSFNDIKKTKFIEKNKNKTANQKLLNNNESNLKISSQIFKSYSKSEFKGTSKRNINYKQKNATKTGTSSTKNLKKTILNKNNLFSSKTSLVKKTSDKNINTYNKQKSNDKIKEDEKLISKSASPKITENEKKDLGLKNIITNKQAIFFDISPIIKHNKKKFNIKPVENNRFFFNQNLYNFQKYVSYRNVIKKKENNSLNIYNTKISSISEKNRCKNSKKSSLNNKICTGFSKKKNVKNLSKKQLSIKYLIKDITTLNNNKKLPVKRTPNNL